MFYVDHALETIVDPILQPAAQPKLLDELRRYEDLMHLDLRYAKLVAGASKMPMNMVWVARNQDDSVSDVDLASLRDVAWNEFIRKRFLPAIPSSATIGEATASMLEIVQQMNLQRRRFQVMGLHEQVEACEVHLILHLCQAGILHADDCRKVANRFRRSDKLFDAFGLAVGAFVCASAPHTLGAATTRYERDLQFEYKKNCTALFIYRLRNSPGATVNDGFEDDYVGRISRLIVLGERAIAVGPSSSTDGDDHPFHVSSVLNIVATAQNKADQAFVDLLRMKDEIQANNTLLDEKVSNAEDRVNTAVDRILETTRREHELSRAQLQSQISDFKAAFARDIQTGRLSDELRTGLRDVNEAMRREITEGLEGRMAALEQGIRTEITELQKTTDEVLDGVVALIDPLPGQLDTLQTMVSQINQAQMTAATHLPTAIQQHLLGILRDNLPGIIRQDLQRITQDELPACVQEALTVALQDLPQRIRNEMQSIATEVARATDQRMVAFGTEIDEVLDTMANTLNPIETNLQHLVPRLAALERAHAELVADTNAHFDDTAAQLSAIQRDSADVRELNDGFMSEAGDMLDALNSRIDAIQGPPTDDGAPNPKRARTGGDDLVQLVTTTTRAHVEAAPFLANLIANLTPLIQRLVAGHVAPAAPAAGATDLERRVRHLEDLIAGRVEDDTTTLYVPLPPPTNAAFDPPPAAR